MKCLLMDCSSGISGDMFLSALTSLGCDFAPLENIFRAAGVELSINAKSVSRASGPGIVTVIEGQPGLVLRGAADLAEIAARLDVSEAVRKTSLEMLKRLAQAEAEVYGASADRPSAYSLPGVDALACVVGAAWALEQLSVSDVVCRPLPWFGGFVDSERGRVSLPAPITLFFLQGKPAYESGAAEELITPTGALLLDTLVDNFIHPERPERFAHMVGSVASPGVFEKSGLGYGSREPGAGSDWPGRGLLLHLFSTLPAKDEEIPYIIDEVYAISCHIDHLTGEEIGHAVSVLTQSGALDVLWLPGLTKKNRPGGELRVLCMLDMLPIMEKEIFKHTHTLDIRVTRQTRVRLPRKAAELNSPWGPMDAKEYKLLDQTFTKAEYDALAETAAREGIGLPALRIFEGKGK